MTKALRSNFEPGSTREAARGAQWKALGLSDGDLRKPKVAVVNSSSELAICMHIVCEALGMTLPGSAPVLANSPAMFDAARRSGERIVKMVWDDVKPRHRQARGARRHPPNAVHRSRYRVRQRPRRHSG